MQQESLFRCAVVSSSITHFYIVEQFYKNHHLWLSAWLRKKLGSPMEASDLAQDTFVGLLLKKDLSTITEPRAYLTTIAHGLMVSHLRRRDLEKSYLEALAHFSPAEVPSPETRAIVLETLIKLDEMLDGLPPKVRKAYLLLQLEGLSYAEIALQLGVTTRTVGNYIAKALLHCMVVKESL